MDTKHIAVLLFFGILCVQNSQQTPFKCTLPAVTGRCRANIPRYFFNITSEECEQFVYGGCDGNDNNFETTEECERECRTNEDPCLQPMEVGICRASVPSYYYDHTAGTCKLFIYGGCGGNDNNFETQQDCLDRCMPQRSLHIQAPGYAFKCTLPAESGRCRAYMPRYFFNITSEKCEQFIYGGCGGNDNNFETTEECETECTIIEDPCLQPKEVGVCRAIIPSYYYDHTSGTCKQFIYGGCGGNNNNFPTHQDCSDRCMPQRSLFFQSPEYESFYHCFLKPETAGCQALTTKYFYNITLGGCQQYEGCSGTGTANTFDGMEECTESCNGTTHCLLNPDVGPCTNITFRYFYNYTSNKCEMFSYGGCQGNDNNFETTELCEAACALSSTDGLRSPVAVLLLSAIISILLTSVL